MTEPTKAVIYCRTACSPGVENDSALQVQEEACRLARDLALSDELEAACNRLGHEIIVVDENYDAGYEPILPGMLQSLIRLLKKHEDHQL